MNEIPSFLAGSDLSNAFILREQAALHVKLKLGSGDTLCTTF
jgi:hypothetical protein